MSSRPLTPPYVRFRIRRFNDLSAVPRIFWICHHTRLMRGIRLSRTYGESSYRLFANSQAVNLPTPTLCLLGRQAVSGCHILRKSSSIASRISAVFCGVSIRSAIGCDFSYPQSHNTQATLLTFLRQCIMKQDANG